MVARASSLQIELLPGVFGRSAGRKHCATALSTALYLQLVGALHFCWLLRIRLKFLFSLVELFLDDADDVLDSALEGLESRLVLSVFRQAISHHVARAIKAFQSLQ